MDEKVMTFKSDEEGNRGGVSMNGNGVGNGVGGSGGSGVGNGIGGGGNVASGITTISHFSNNSIGGISKSINNIRRTSTNLSLPTSFDSPSKSNGSCSFDNVKLEANRLNTLSYSPSFGATSPSLLAHNASALSSASSPASGSCSYFPRPPLFRNNGSIGIANDNNYTGLSFNIGNNGIRTRASSTASLTSYSTREKIWDFPEMTFNKYISDDSLSSRRHSHFDINQSYFAENSHGIAELPEVYGYSELQPIYPYYYNSVSMYRATDRITNEPVLMKISTRGSLEDLTRIRHEWSVVYPESSSSTEIDHIDGVLRPERCLRIGDDPSKVVLVYPNKNHLVTLREKYISSVLPKVKPSSINSSSPSPESPKIPERTTQEIIDILKIIIAVAKTLAKIHDNTLTHNGLTTSTIFIDDHNETFISGWDFSFSLRAEDTSRGYRKTHLKQIADCMGYVSPETTCLINRLVDYRADFYSIGCIIYEILLGRLPFRSSDPSQLSHMHVLRTPIAPSLVADWVPETLSRIIMKLLEKNADDRYQSAKLVISDLEMVLQSLEDPDSIDEEDFVPGSIKSVSSTFMVPQLIYGRDSELAALQTCYKRNDETDFQFVFVIGEPGSGKSRLIGELERSAIASNSFFSVTKYDEYQRGPPFYTIVTVLKDIVHQILSGSVEYITHWRDTIITSLKVDLSVLFDPIPELKELLGYEYLMLLPKSRPLGPVPREMRFKFVVKSLFCLFGAQGLTVFLDDIQWCPPSELSLFRELSIFVNEKYNWSVHITFVCASTPDSWNTYSGLARLARELNGLYEEVYLNPLSFEAVREIVNDTFGNSSTRHTNGIRRRRRSHNSQQVGNEIIAKVNGNAPRSYSTSTPSTDAHTVSVAATKYSSLPVNASVVSSAKPEDDKSSTLIPKFQITPSVDPQVQSLSETIYTVTTGNPLFISFLLKYLYYEQYIYYDDTNRITGAKWKVDFEGLNLSAVPKSVTEVVILILKKLPPQTNRILRYAACICSNSFTLEDLAIGANVSFSEAATALHAALDYQLILPTSIHYKFPFLDPVGTTNIELYDDEIRRVAAASTYRFYHDLVQQAVYSRLETQEALETHRLIGLRLLGDGDAQSTPTHRLLEIANQLKNAVPIVKEDEKSVYIELNVMAGNAVYAMSDFDMAYAYFETASRLLGDDSKPSYSEEINLKLVELQYNRKNYNDCIKLVDNSLHKFPSLLSKAALLRIKAMALYGEGESTKATTTGLEALKLLGYEIHEDEDWNREYCRKLKPRIPVSASEIRELANIKRGTDLYSLLAQQIIATISIRLYLSGKMESLRSLVFTSLILVMDHGSSSACAFSLLSLANLFQKDGGSSNLTLAYEYSKLAIVISEYDTDVSMDFGVTIYEYYALTLAIYFEPLQEVIKYYDIVLSSGQVIGSNSGNLTTSYDLRPLCKLIAGEPLQSVFQSFERIKPADDYESGKLWILLHVQGLYNLMGSGSTDPSSLEGSYFGNRDSVIKVMQSNSIELKYAYFLLKMVLAVIHRHKYIAAHIICNELPELIIQAPITVYHVMVTFYGALALIDKCPKSESDETQLNQFANDLQIWSKQCPSMFLHKYLLVKAEMNIDCDNSIVTLDTYEDAIKYALEGGFINEAAMINERCGDYLQEHSKQRSLTYIKEACRLYSLWGAQRKVALLNSKYSELATPSYELPRMNVSSTDLQQTVMPDFRQQRSSLPPGSFLLQNSSPLRWILSNLFREESTDGHDITEEDSSNASFSTKSMRLVRKFGDDGKSSVGLYNNNTNKQGDHDQEFKAALQACLDISESIDMSSIVTKLIESVMKTLSADYCVFISLDEDGELYVDAIGILNGVTIVSHEPLIVRTDAAPINLLQQVISTGSSVNRGSDVKRFENVYGRDNYFNHRHSQSVLCMPIQNQIKIIGALYVEQQSLPKIFTVPKIELSTLLCTAAAVSIEKAKLYQQMDLAKKAAEEATAEKASFLANMSHEIRTPFNALLSCSIFLLDTELSEIQREYVETIRSSAGLTLNIIDAILAFSKIEHGSITLDNSPFSLRECVESAVQLVAEPAATKDLELVYLNKCGEIDTIYGDVTRVRQIIINLVGNAVKFTSKGHIVVETTVEKVSSENRYEFVISVSDTGTGIPKSARNKLFRAFSQVDGSSRRAYGGSGLGLAISKKLAEIMGATLTFESTEGVGTTFWFNLVATAQKPSEKDVRMYSTKRCLVADGHNTAKESLRTELQRLGFEVDQCSTSITAAEIVNNHKPNYYSLVFIDFKLLESEEFKESKMIKKHSPLTQVIYMTIFGVTIPDNSEEKGISGILMRPVQRSRLTQIIRKILNSSWSISNQVKFATTTHDKGMFRTLAVRHPLKILLAEDNMINKRVALQHLKRMGYNADHAKDGIEVLEMCERELKNGNGMYDCILMDIQMPRKDGIAAAQDLNERYEAHIRPSVIALTANVAGEDRQKCLSSGMVNYIAKPILPADLAAVLMGVKPLKERSK